MCAMERELLWPRLSDDCVGLSGSPIRSRQVRYLADT